MKFGVHFGSRGVAGDPDTLKAVAQKAEALGYEHFGMSDHVIVATEVESAYPYSKTGKFFAQDTGISLEQVTALSFVAATTSRIRLLTSVLVLPHRHPVLAAKMLATVDVLSKGRLTVGVGVGWMSEEIALLGGPPFSERAKASEEYIAGFLELWTKEKPVQRGTYATFDKLLFAPKTVQKPHAPIWVGERPKALASVRVGSATAGIPSPSIRAFRSTRPNSMPVHLQRFTTKPSAPTAILAKSPAPSSPFPAASDAKRNVTTAGDSAFTGSAQAIVDDIGRYRQQGLRTFLIGGDGHDLNRTLDLLEQFASEVMAKCG